MAATKTPKEKRGSPADLPPGVNALLTPAQVATALTMHIREFHRLRLNGGFPDPESPEGKRPRWKTSTVNAWIEEHYPSGKRLPS